MMAAFEHKLNCKCVLCVCVCQYSTGYWDLDIWLVLTRETNAKVVVSWTVFISELLEGEASQILRYPLKC